METIVLFDVEGAEAVAELRLHLAHGEVLVARGAGEDHRTALDRAEERLKRQASRVSGRFRTARHSPADIQP
jgi:ribosome-associated translation inhibitor RaiA